jgi:hypothetical protein
VIELAEPRPADAPVPEQIGGLMSSLPAVEAFAAVEHRFGVLPLIGAFFASEGVVAGRRLGALGLFTPTPALGWEAAALAGEMAGGGLTLRGVVRLPGSGSGGALVLARLEGGELRLVWLDPDAPGVGRAGSRNGGPAREGFPAWLVLAGAGIDPSLVSRPVALAELRSHLESYAGVWALAAAACAADGIRALRRAARTHGHGGTAFSAAQRIALGITELEIEAELAAAAARQHHELGIEGGGLALAAAAARTLAGLAGKTAELRDREGLVVDGPFALDGPARVLTAYLGGSAMIESELARALGLRDLAAPEAVG